MSRTNRGNRGADKEYWKSRLHEGGETPGPATKKLTHRKERRRNRKICREALRGNRTAA
jgi:hypothetical protein